MLAEFPFFIFVALLYLGPVGEEDLRDDSSPSNDDGAFPLFHYHDLKMLAEISERELSNIGAPSSPILAETHGDDDCVDSCVR